MSEDRRRTLGRLGEQAAASHLKRLGFSVLERNVRTRHGEIDLIAFDGHTLVFAEVKARLIGARQQTIRADQEPLGGLSVRQRTRLRRLATAWLGDEQRERPSARTIRFDAIGVILDTHGTLRRLDHIEAAW
jgi:putative endonuclease